MRRQDRINTILLYAGAQAAWLCLLALWIYWFVRNYMIFIEVGERLSPQLVLNSQNVVALVIGIVLLAALMTSLTIIFTRLNRQMKLTRLYDNFIANVTHELKSPLASIQMYLETLLDRKVPPKKQEEFIGLMIKDAQRLESQINTILELSGLEDRKSLFHLERYQADDLVRRVCEDTAEALNLPAGAYRIEGRADCLCRVDENALRIVFMNLFDNAVKYSIGQVTIAVSLCRSGKRLYIDVRDRGIGISKKDKKEVFKKFRRLYYPEVPSVKGTGLGLYRVKEIIRFHRGRIKVLSSGAGTGTTFRIRLPIITAEKPEKRRKKRRKS